MNVANKITIFRTVLSPILVLFFYLSMDKSSSPFCNPFWMAVVLFISLIQDGSDIIDGILARKKNIITDFGKLIDPLADNICHFTSFLCLLWANFIPLWAVIIIFYREVMVSILRIYAAKNNIVLSARISGKIKTIVYGGAINFILFFIILYQYFQNIPIILISNILISITIGVTIYSGIDYVIATKKMFKS